MRIEYMFCSFVSNNALKIISSRKTCGLFSLIFKKIIPNKTTPTFQEVCGVASPLTLCRWHKNVSWYMYRVNYHKID